MQDWATFIWTVAASSVGTTILLGVLGYLLRTQITHLLNKDLESIKAQHQRDLAAYNVGLIAESERTKAIQAVKTAAALRSVERKFALFEALHDAIQGHHSTVLATLTVNQTGSPLRAVAIEKCQARIDRLAVSLDAAAAYLNPDEHIAVLKLHIAINSVLMDALAAPASVPFVVSPERNATIAQLVIPAIAVPRAHLDAMLGMQ